MSKLSAPERGLKPATTYSDQSELIHFSPGDEVELINLHHLELG
jgi:hypothetical protein